MVQTFQENIHLTNKLEYGNLVTPLRDKGRPIYNWYLFKHSYSRELVTRLLNMFKLSKGDWVLDPFCGCGTTLLASKELGVSSVGYDILPFSIFLTNTKINSFFCDTSLLRKQLKNFKIKSSIKNLEQIENIGIIKKAFNPQVLRTLLRIRDAIYEISPQIHQDLFMLSLLSILEKFSMTKKGGGFLRLVHKEVNALDILPTFKHKISDMTRHLEEVDCASLKDPKIACKAELCDARKLHTKRKFDALVTSPPYPNRHDYTRIYALELIIAFVRSNDELKRIRYETLRSHVEAKPKYNAKKYLEPETLTTLLSNLSKRELNNKEVISMLRGYFEDMFLSMSEVSRCLKLGGHAAFVVSNARFAGLTIPVDLLLAEIAQQVYLTVKHILVVRFRGNSSQQMAKYHRVPSRESIVILRRSN